ncbi:MAG: hypothetical protein SAJ37_22280 [Oscillatoria sp. PMC 1068.18]|nr:hypothetical protein [Oscillatoria sp. PMC 1076.18]MEC4991472.1 hypothetical protein [Oscillatoria sp. PMC 1068.18]
MNKITKRFWLWSFWVLALFAIAQISIAQERGFRWARQGGGVGENVARGVSADRWGNVVVTGSFKEKINFARQELNSSGYQDIFITKYDDNGEVIWVKHLGGRGRDFAFDIVQDEQGNSLVTGLFSEQVNFDEFSLRSFGSGDMFTAKINSSGTVIWVKQAGGRSLDGGNEIATDQTGNALVIANTYGTVKVDDTFLRHQGSQDIFITKYNPNGTLLWAKQIAGENSEQGRGISSDRANNVLVTGQFTGTINLSGKQLTSRSQQKDIFLAKYDPNGNILWAKSFGGWGEDYGRGVAADERGNIYFTGVFSNQVEFDNYTLNSRAGSRDLFLAKADPNGKILWVRQMGGFRADEGSEIEVDAAGNAYISGEFSDRARFGSRQLNSLGARDLFVAKFDPQGNLKWLERAGGNGDDVNYGISLAPEGKVTTVGTFTNSAEFGNFRLTSPGNTTDFFVFQLDKR